MLPWFKKLLFSEQSFVSYIRAALLILGYVAESGKLGLPADWEWVGYLFMGAAVFIRAGEPNAKTAVLLLLLLLPITVQAQYMTCDPPPAGEVRTGYDIRWDGAATPTRVPAPLRVDLAPFPNGRHDALIRSVAVDTWTGDDGSTVSRETYSDYVPWGFVRTGQGAKVPAGLRIQETLP